MNKAHISHRLYVGNGSTCPIWSYPTAAKARVTFPLTPMLLLVPLSPRVDAGLHYCLLEGVSQRTVLSSIQPNFESSLIMN